ncbi:multicopper oxidase family protein [Agromyces arachidis]|uniref:multicopper oxidase family protein n=1 Tax=Agromyces arachidis TaxID=766966 RepID=UPI0040579952
MADPDLSRRAVLIAGAAGAAAVAVGGGVALWNLTSDGPAVPPDGATTVPETDAGDAPDGETFGEPEVLASADGRLDLELAAAIATATVGGAEVRVLAYDGTMPGPTLRVRPGDRITLRLRNDLGAVTNLHTHGLVVSPEGDSDNVFTMIEPGTSFDYDYRLGDDHPAGVFWYHPHHHGTTADQLFGGLYGAIIVEDDADEVPVARERLLVVADIRFDASGAVAAATRSDRMLGREGDLVLVNGRLLPTMAAAPGARERWRIVNACTSRYLRLRLDGQRMALLGVDGARYAEPRELDEFVLLPGNRADVLVELVEGESVLRTLPFDRGRMGMMGAPPSATEGADLVRLTVAGAASAPGGSLPSVPAPRDLRAESVTGRRTLTLAMGGMGMGGGMAFTIDGQAFDHDRTDIEVDAGAIEEWTIVNTSTMDHPFHLHVWPMQLVEVDGVPLDRVDVRDVVPVPALGRVVVRIAFEGITGRTVYHCHILDHEDLGMMGIIRVG